MWGLCLEKNLWKYVSGTQSYQCPITSTADIKGLKNGKVIQDYQNRLLDALMKYTTTHYPSQQTKFGELLLRLSEVQR